MHYFHDQQPTLLPRILWRLFVLVITHLIYLSVIFFFWGTILLLTLWYVEPHYSKSLQTGPVAYCSLFGTCIAVCRTTAKTK